MPIRLSHTGTIHCVYQHEADRLRHGGWIAVTKSLYSKMSFVHPLCTPAIHSEVGDVSRVPITSVMGCPLGAFNRGWERFPADLQSRQVGAGNQEHSPANIRRTNIVSAELKSGDIEAIAGKIVTDFGFPRRVSRGLLHDNEMGLCGEDDAQHVGPEGCTCPLTADRCGDARGLAGRSADADGWAPALWNESSDVIMDRNSWKILAENAAAKRVNLTKLVSLYPGALETESVAADAGEKIE